MAANEKRVSELSDHVGGTVVGDGEVVIRRVNSLEAAGEGDIAYVEDEKFFEAAARSNASCVIVPESAALELPCAIKVKKPKLAFALIAEILHPPKRRESDAHPSAVIADTADVALTAFVGPHVTIGDRSTVGVGTQILSGVTIGDNVFDRQRLCNSSERRHLRRCDDWRSSDSARGCRHRR